MPHAICHALRAPQAMDARESNAAHDELESCLNDGVQQELFWREEQVA